MVLPIALFAGVAYTAWQDARRHTDDDIARALDVIREHTLKVFRTAELLILGVTALTENMADAEIAADAARLHAHMRRMAASLGEDESVWITSREGRILATDALYPAPEIDARDRDYFRAHVARDAGTHIGAVLVPKLPDRPPFFTVSRRRPPEQSFNGTIHVGIPPGQIARFFGDLAELGDYFALIREDGSFLARFPPPKDQAQRATAPGPPEVLAHNPERGFYTAASSLDRRERRVGYRKLATYPVYVLAGVETAAVRAKWMETLRQQLLFGLPATALLVASLVFALNRTRRLCDEEEKRAAAEEVLRRQQGLEALGQMTGGVAHDFNNLLMVILSAVGQLRRSIAGEKERRWLDAIDSAGRTGERLTRQLLSFARRQTLAPQAVDIAARLDGLAEMLQRSLRGDIQLAIRAQGRPCVAMIDFGEFEIALLNLAVNARDAMPEGGRLEVGVSRRRLDGQPDGLRGEFVLVAVRDTGAGMPPNVQQQAFTPFFTTKGTGKGTGLGLSQVYGFARQSGGTATIESQPGQGTVVTLFLPCGTLVPPAAAASAQNEAPIGAGRRALVVEDNPGVADATRNHLEQLGFVVAVADRAAAALRLVEADPPDLVLSDIVMPGGNGLDLAREIRRRWPRIPVVLATGFSESAEQAGRDGFTILRKPYDIERLRGALLAVLPALATTD
ncbi:MAG: response regulator [Alphaproteobacteria bacterium]|nr:response regulator [Alphaproteobacteria bacterium]